MQNPGKQIKRFHLFSLIFLHLCSMSSCNMMGIRCSPLNVEAYILYLISILRRAFLTTVLESRFLESILSYFQMSHSLPPSLSLSLFFTHTHTQHCILYTERFLAELANELAGERHFERESAPRVPTSLMPPRLIANHNPYHLSLSIYIYIYLSLSYVQVQLFLTKIRYKIILNSDAPEFGGHDRIQASSEFFTEPKEWDNRPNSMLVRSSLARTQFPKGLDRIPMLLLFFFFFSSSFLMLVHSQIYAPSRCAIVLVREEEASIAGHNK